MLVPPDVGLGRERLATQGRLSREYTGTALPCYLPVLSLRGASCDPSHSLYVRALFVLCWTKLAFVMSHVRKRVSRLMEYLNA